MLTIKKVLIAISLLLFAGVLRMPLERPLARELRSTGILEQQLDLDTSQALGQTSAAIAFGGLRSLVAAVLNFSKVVPAWDEKDWLGIFTTFQQIHALQPRVGYYWEAAAGYAADDAYSDYRDRSDTPEWQRKLRRQEFFTKGVSYLDQGLQNLPQEISLYALKARFFSDIHKQEQLDYARAVAVLDEAIQLPGASDVLRRQRFYLMARVPDRRREALDLAREIYAEPTFRYPSVKSLLFALQNEFPNAEGEQVPTQEIYRDRAEVLRSLFNYYQRRDRGFPIVGVKEELDEIAATMALPHSLDPLRNSDIKRVTLNLSQLHASAPLVFPHDPYAPDTDWPLVVNMFQEFGSQSPPTVRVLYLVLQSLAGVSVEERVPPSQIFPDKLVAVRDLANFFYDSSHQYPNDLVENTLREFVNDINLPDDLNPVLSPNLFPLTREWMNEVRQRQIDAVNLAP